MCLFCPFVSFLASENNDALRFQSTESRSTAAAARIMKSLERMWTLERARNALASMSGSLSRGPRERIRLPSLCTCGRVAFEGDSIILPASLFIATVIGEREGLELWKRRLRASLFMPCWATWGFVVLGRIMGN